MIGEYWRGDRSLRSVRVLLDGLPPDNAVSRAHYGHAWTTDVPWLLADTVDALNMQVALTHNANQPKGKQVKAPDKLPRPEMPDEAGPDQQPDDGELDQIRAEMDQMRTRLFTQA